MLTGATSLACDEPQVASPEADTPSYLPVFMSVTISSEVLPTVIFTLQPVAFSKPVTQSTLGSVAPFST